MVSPEMTGSIGQYLPKIADIGLRGSSRNVGDQTDILSPAVTQLGDASGMVRTLFYGDICNVLIIHLFRKFQNRSLFHRHVRFRPQNKLIKNKHRYD